MNNKNEIDKIVRILEENNQISEENGEKFVNLSHLFYAVFGDDKNE